MCTFATIGNETYGTFTNRGRASFSLFFKFLLAQSDNGSSDMWSFCFPQKKNAPHITTHGDSRRLRPRGPVCVCVCVRVSVCVCV